MHTLTAWFIRNPVAANLIMLLILVAGYLSLTNLRIEGFPKIPPDTVAISVYFPGASAAQVDESITQKIEKSLKGLPGVQKVVSFSNEASAYVQVKKESGYELEALFDGVKGRISELASLPKAAERPLVSKETFSFPALIVQVYGDVERDVLQRVGGQVKNALLARSEITKLNSWGEESSEISIEFSPEKLQAYGLSVTDLALAINQISLLATGGLLHTSAGRIRIRADQQAYAKTDFAVIPLSTTSDGSQLRLGDVATITQGFATWDGAVRYQGQAAIGFEILIDGKGNLLDVSKVANEVVAQMNAVLPQKVHVDVWADQSEYITDRLNLLRTYALQGLLLVLVILSLFLNIKIALWVAVGIPISLAGCLWVMGWDVVNYSLNDITTFGLIVVLGVLVDDVIVVAESVYSERLKNPDPIIGTEIGVNKVATATIFGTMTSVAAFYPMLLIDNPIGKVLAGFSGVVIIALLFSLLESKWILPSHLAAIRMEPTERRNPVTNAWLWLKSSLDAGLQWWKMRLYLPFLGFALANRYAAFIAFSALAVVGIGMATSGLVRTSFFPDVPGSVITVKMDMDALSPPALTHSQADWLEQQALEMNQEFMVSHGLSRPPIEKIMTAVNNARQVEIYAELTPEKVRSVGADALVTRWREKVGHLEGVESLDFTNSEATGGGFMLVLTADSEAVIEAGVSRIRQALQNMDAIHNVQDDLKGGQAEIYLSLKPEAQHWGISVEQLSTQVAHYYSGLEAQRFQRDSEEVKVMLRNKLQWRNGVDDLLNGRIQTAQGEWVTLSTVAELKSRYVTDVVWRRNGKRAASIRADLDQGKLTSSEVYRLLQVGVIAELSNELPALSVLPAGDVAEEDALSGDLKTALIMALLLIYALMAIPLKSYLQPLVIMSVIPFAIAGAIAGHYIAGIPLSVLSFFGMLALTGIVVNDSLVLMTTYNQQREEGLSMQEAMKAAGSMRFRAILLTTVTTVAGLAPLLMETSEQAQYLIPAAVSLAYGEIFATLITLFMVPILTLILADIKGLWYGKNHDKKVEEVVA